MTGVDSIGESHAVTYESVITRYWLWWLRRPAQKQSHHAQHCNSPELKNIRTALWFKKQRDSENGLPASKRLKSLLVSEKMKIKKTNPRCTTRFATVCYCTVWTTSASIKRMLDQHARWKHGGAAYMLHYCTRTTQYRVQIGKDISSEGPGMVVRVLVGWDIVRRTNSTHFGMQKAPTSTLIGKAIQLE